MKICSSASLLALFLPCGVSAQGTAEAGIGPDSIQVVAARGFAAGSFHRRMLGDNYRDVWSTPIRVPVLHITRFAGGLTPYKLGGGNQTVSLRMLAPDSGEYVFRPVYKSGIRLPQDFRGTIVWWMFEDQWSASHPGANVAPVPMMNYFGILNPHARLVFMPDDPALGEYRKQFAGVLGTLEDYPTVPKAGRAFAGAVDVIDAEELLKSINKDPFTQVDARKVLRVRMLDMLLGDNDRHADQWRWARLVKGGLFEPVARDRDKVFVSYNGTLLNLARRFQPALVRFDSAYSDPTALFENATNFDRRILGGLDKSVWDSTARALQREISDSLIDATIAAMPREYAAQSQDLAGRLRARRSALPGVALLYYSQLFKLAEVHATDTADVATVDRRKDGSVDVSIRFDGKAPWFKRHYDPADTREIRLYLHGGDDSATVTGTAASSIPVRIIGGNGHNTLIDQSVVGGRSMRTELYDEGDVSDVRYVRDTVLERESYVDALNHYYNRRPAVYAYGKDMLPGKDFGSSVKPVVGLKTGHGLGLVPKIGIAYYRYGFRSLPYSSMIQADAALSTGTRGWKFDLLGDKRFPSSDFHIAAIASMSQLEVIQFRGFGNDVAEDDDPFFDVRQRQWTFRPAVGFTFAPGSDITFGPTVRYTTTDSVRSGFLSVGRPYGFDTFKEVGAQLALQFDSRNHPDSTKPRFIVDFTASGYPGTWDAKSAYESLEGVAVGYMTIPLLTKPVIALRGGGKKLYGNFPYFDAAFLGGGSSFRTEHRQRFAGDASVYGSAELRVPLITFPAITPTNIGVLAFTDAGRVYVDGESPGGWHTASGAGFWVAAMNAARNVNVLFTNQSNRRVMVSLGFAY